MLQGVPGREGRVDAVRSHDDLLLGEAVEPDEIGARAFRDSQHAARGAGSARHDAPEDEPVLQPHVRRAVLEREIVDRDHRRARRANGDGVLRVHERRARPAEQLRQRPEHPQLLERRPQHEWLDPFGHELGMASRRGNPEAGGVRERSQLAQQVPHVRLVAGPAATEHVRVHDHERLAHASARR